MKKLILISAISACALASNYRIMPLSPEGLALSGTNVAKSYGADAAIYNPANMGFLGDRVQIAMFANLYHVGGAKFDNKLDNSINSTSYYAYANSSDAHGIDYNFGLGSAAVVFPINEDHYLGFAIYTDMAAVYGWDTPYARMLVSNFDIRSGTAALSYAYKPFEDLSVAASLTVNHAKLKYALDKTKGKNPRYFGNPRVCLVNGTCSVADVVDHIYGPSNPNDNRDFSNISYKEHFVYEGDFRGDNGYPIGYKLSATYSPSYFDHKLNISAVYNSKYNSDFDGAINYEMSRWTLFDFITDALVHYPDAAASFPMPDNVDFLDAILMPIFHNMTDESPSNRGKIKGPATSSFDYPASINISASYSLDRHDFLFSYAHTFWSKTHNLQMKLNYVPVLKNPAIDTSLLDVILGYVVVQPVKIKWHDTDFFGLGYRYNGDQWSLMAGIATENTPLPRREMTFMSKDARLYQFSGGIEYSGFKDLSIQLAFAHQQFAKVSTGYVDDVLVKSMGTFHGQSTQIISAGFKYVF